MTIKPEAVQYKIDRAKESLAEARLLQANGYCFTTINRLYYCIFYAVTAALLKKGLICKTHAGTRITFHENFINSGLISSSVLQVYNTLFNKRQASDYNDMFNITEPETEELIVQTEETLNILLNFIPTIEQ